MEFKKSGIIYYNLFYAEFVLDNHKFNEFIYLDCKLIVDFLIYKKEEHIDLIRAGPINKVEVFYFYKSRMDNLQFFSSFDINNQIRSNLLNIDYFYSGHKSIIYRELIYHGFDITYLKKFVLFWEICSESGIYPKLFYKIPELMINAIKNRLEDLKFELSSIQTVIEKSKIFEIKYGFISKINKIKKKIKIYQNLDPKFYLVLPKSTRKIEKYFKCFIQQIRTKLNIQKEYKFHYEGNLYDATYNLFSCLEECLAIRIIRTI